VSKKWERVACGCVHFGPPPETLEEKKTLRQPLTCTKFHTPLNRDLDRNLFWGGRTPGLPCFRPSGPESLREVEEKSERERESGQGCFWRGFGYSLVSWQKDAEG
jgi:hypothetical protein